MKTIDKVFNFIYNFQKSHYFPGDNFNSSTNKEIIDNFKMYCKFFKEKNIEGLSTKAIYVKENSGKFYFSNDDNCYFYKDMDGLSSYNRCIDCILYVEDNYVITSKKNEKGWIFQFFKFESENDKNKFIMGISI